MPKITSLLRRMKGDREFCDAVFAFIDATDRLREIERLHRYNPDKPAFNPRTVRGGRD